MIDTYLFYSLLQGINHNIKLILVGDSNQLPSVGPGMILKDIINSNLFTHIPLEHIYRQSENSYIPILAREIKSKKLNPEFMEQKDDYNFLNASGPSIKEMITPLIAIIKSITVYLLAISLPLLKFLGAMNIMIHYLLKKLHSSLMDY